MTSATEAVQLPDVVVDRSPELARGAVSWRVPRSGRISAVTMAPVGVRGDSGSCALARVICETLHEVKEAHVGGEHPYVILHGGTRRDFALTPELAEWIGRFDRGEPVEPIRIEFGGGW